MKGSKSASGYIKVELKNDTDKKGKLKCIHILVANAFHGIPKDINLIVDHINGNIEDNNIWNLRWATRSEQALNRKDFVPKGREIYQLDIYGNIIKKWTTIREAESTLGLNHSNISHACKNNSIYGGYYWRYCDEILRWEDPEGPRRLEINSFS